VLGAKEIKNLSKTCLRSRLSRQYYCICVINITGNKKENLALSITEPWVSLSDWGLSSAWRSASSRQKVHHSGGILALVNVVY